MKYRSSLSFLIHQYFTLSQISPHPPHHLPPRCFRNPKVIFFLRKTSQFFCFFPSQHINDIDTYTIEQNTGCNFHITTPGPRNSQLNLKKYLSPAQAGTTCHATLGSNYGNVIYNRNERKLILAPMKILHENNATLFYFAKLTKNFYGNII